MDKHILLEQLIFNDSENILSNNNVDELKKNFLKKNLNNELIEVKKNIIMNHNKIKVNYEHTKYFIYTTSNIEIISTNSGLLAKNNLLTPLIQENYTHILNEKININLVKKINKKKIKIFDLIRFMAMPLQGLTPCTPITLIKFYSNSKIIIIKIIIMTLLIIYYIYINFFPELLLNFNLIIFFNSLIIFNSLLNLPHLLSTVIYGTYKYKQCTFKNKYDKNIYIFKILLSLMGLIIFIFKYNNFLYSVFIGFLLQFSTGFSINYDFLNLILNKVFGNSTHNNIPKTQITCPSIFFEGPPVCVSKNELRITYSEMLERIQNNNLNIYSDNFYKKVDPILEAWENSRRAQQIIISIFNTETDNPKIIISKLKEAAILKARFLSQLVNDNVIQVGEINEILERDLLIYNRFINDPENNKLDIIRKNLFENRGALSTATDFKINNSDQEKIKFLKILLNAENKNEFESKLNFLIEQHQAQLLAQNLDFQEDQERELALKQEKYFYWSFISISIIAVTIAASSFFIVGNTLLN